MYAIIVKGCKEANVLFNDVFFYMHHPTDRIAHTTVFVIPVVENWLECEIAQWVHHERTFYHGATFRSPAGLLLNIIHSL